MSLKLSNNKILGPITSFLDTFKLFTTLEKLDLARDNVCGKEIDVYRTKVFYVLPVLKVLDKLDRDGFSIPNDDEKEGKIIFMIMEKMVKNL